MRFLLVHLDQLASVIQVQASSTLTESTHLDPVLASTIVGGRSHGPPSTWFTVRPGAICRHALPVNSSRPTEHSLLHAVKATPRSSTLNLSSCPQSLQHRVFHSWRVCCNTQQVNLHNITHIKSHTGTPRTEDEPHTGAAAYTPASLALVPRSRGVHAAQACY